MIIPSDIFKMRFVFFVLFFVAADVLPAKEVSESEASEKFLRVARRIQKDYVHTISLDKLLHGALRGMVESLDINSTYMSPEEFQQIKTQVDGQYGGLGIDVILRRGRLIIISVADASPATSSIR